MDPERLNEVLIRPIHRGPMLNDILPRLVGMEYLKLIDVSSGYHNLKLQVKIITSNKIFMSVWLVSTHTTTVWSSPSGIQIPVENR